MNKETNQEVEVKFYLLHPKAFSDRLTSLGILTTCQRTHEYNLCFDTLKGELLGNNQILRLRRDAAARLTFKGPLNIATGVKVRPEIEFTVSDFDSAKELVEALGYHVSWVYEKYRTTYSCNEFIITIDETPLGVFSEIEGRDADGIQDIVGSLKLKWNARLLVSYIDLFWKVKRTLDLKFRDMTFGNFAGIQVPVEILEVEAADA